MFSPEGKEYESKSWVMEEDLNQGKIHGPLGSLKQELNINQIVTGHQNYL